MYLELAPGAKLRRVQTPFLEGAMSYAKGEPQTCTACGAKNKKGLDLAEVAAQANAARPPQGVLAPIVSKVLMKVLYAARAQGKALVCTAQCRSDHFSVWLPFAPHIFQKATKGSRPQRPATASRPRATKRGSIV